MASPPDLREIRVFLAVAEELHFSRAAERLLLTPSRVSQTIRSLEARVGGRLFDRTSRRVTLTPLGQDLQRDLQVHYTAMEEAFARARESAAGLSGMLRIGTYAPPNGGPHLAEIISTFEARHPACGVTMVDTISRDQWEWLRRNEVDVEAARLPISEPGITIGPRLCREGRVLAVARRHPLAGRASVGYEELAEYVVTDVPTIPREAMDAFVPPCTPSGRRLARAPISSMIEIIMRTATGEIVHPTVRSFVDHFAHPDLVAIPIHDLPPSETALVWLTANRSQVVAAFVRSASDVLQSVSDGRR
jgi:DNA-binding transcriptional LysR family regulator